MPLQNTITLQDRYDVVNFLRATIAITTALKEAHEHTMWHLIYSNCAPILTYASNVKHLSSEEMFQCNKALNVVRAPQLCPSAQILKLAFAFSSAWNTNDI